MDCPTESIPVSRLLALSEPVCILNLFFPMVQDTPIATYPWSLSHLSQGRDSILLLLEPQVNNV